MLVGDTIWMPMLVPLPEGLATAAVMVMKALLQKMTCERDCTTAICTFAL